MRSGFYLILLLGVIYFSGCGGGALPTPKLSQVKGTVKMDGKPVVEAIVSFVSTTGEAPIGVTNEQGVYELKLYHDHKLLPGAKPGSYKVSVTSKDPSDNGVLPPGYVDPIPAKYNKNTTLTFDVKEGENVFDIDIKK